MAAAHQAPLSMGFPRQECWSALLFPSPGDLLGRGIKSVAPAFQVAFCLTEPPGDFVLQNLSYFTIYGLISKNLGNILIIFYWTN